MTSFRKNPLILIPLLNVTFLAAVAAPTALAQAQPPREIVLTVGKSMTLNSAANIERVSVGYGDFAEARVVSPKEVLLNAKAPGETSLIIWQEGGNKLFFDVIVRASTAQQRTKLDTLRRQLSEQIPGQNITATYENDTVFLSGKVKDITSADRAVAIASTVGKVINLMYVDVPDSDAQILLKVQFASVDRNHTKELGLNLLSTGTANTLGQVTTGQFGGATFDLTRNTVTLSDALNVFLFRRDLNLGATIKALQTRGLFEILAEPNVLAINGKQASFLAGGEFPYPILQGGGGGVGQVTIAFREFGVRINFLPVLTPRGTIRLEVAPEVSALDFAAGITFQGVNIPGLTTRRVQTEVELDSGQSFAIGGLLDRRLQDTVNKIPLISDIPLLGKIFQSKSLTQSHNELLVIVTPELVRPIPSGQPVPSLTYDESLGDGVLPRTPPISVTGLVPVTPPTPSLPVEKLMESIKFQSEMKLIERRDTGTTASGLVPVMPVMAAPPGAAPSTPPPQNPPK